MIKTDGNPTRAVRGSCELLNDCLIHSASCSEDVEVGENACFVDIDIEFALPGSVELKFREVETNGVFSAYCQVGKVVVEIIIRAMCLVNV